MTNTYSIERLPNGYVLITSLISGSRGLYYSDGRYRSGDLRNVGYLVRP